jgi:hypothetical protein
MDLKEVVCGGMDWIELAQERQVAGTLNVVMNLHRLNKIRGIS